jgi:hypothetical protein
MEEKLSPAASNSSSSHGNSWTPQSRNSAISQLLVTKQPPNHVFPDEWFDIQFDVDIVKGEGSLEGAEFVATLHHQKSKRIVGDDVAFTVTPSGPVRFPSRQASPKRKQTLKCKIVPNEVRRDKACVYFIQLSLTDSSSAFEIMPATSNQIIVVNYKINVTVTDEWESIFYKDEGGRDKCMTIEAVLLNRDGTLYVGQQVPLQTTLYYDNDNKPLKVGRQEILRVLGPSKSLTDRRSGKATIKFRIDDVSKNHQGQDFRVQVAVDSKSKGFLDIAPDFSPAVSIRSKRNKRQRLGSTSRLDPAQYAGSPIGSQQVRVYSGVALAQPPPDASLGGTDTARLREAMTGVLHWMEEVVNGLVPLQWQIIGHAQHPDGSPDYSRPYYSNMQNPNECISRVLSMYSNVTREHAQTLKNAIEGSGPPLPARLVTLPGSSLSMAEGGPGMLGGHGSLPFPMDPRLGPPNTPMHTSMSSRGPPFIDPSVHPMVMSSDMGYPLQSAAAGRDLPQRPMHPHDPMGSSVSQMHPGPMMRIPDMGEIPMSSHAASMPQSSDHPPGKGGSVDRTPIQSLRSFEDENRESEVAYVLAKQFKATRTGERLGFPAYSESKEILGFYRESNMKVGVGQFIPITNHEEDFGPLEIMQATEILNEAMENKSDSVYALKDWGSISNLIDHALVYDWSKDIGSGASGESGD